MRGYFKSPFTIFLAVVAVVLLGVMIFSLATGHKLTPAENAAGTAVSPVQSAASAVRNFFGGIFDFKTKKALSEENAALRSQLADAELKVEELQSLRNENSELRAFLNIYENSQKYDLVYAKVIAFDAGNISSNVTINRGSASGVRKNDAVVSEDGLVGIVFEVGLNYAKVSTVINANSSVGATVVRTRESGILEGSYALRSKGQCFLTMLRSTAAASVGDTVKTSGLGGVYPEGIVIGKVVSVEENEDFTATAVVQTAVNLKTVNGVMVLTNYGMGE